MAQIKFDTKLPQSEAAKTKVFSLISENGLIAKCADILDDNSKFIFSEWKFDDIKNENGSVVFFGTADAGTPLKFLFGTDKTPDNHLSWRVITASYAVCKAYHQAAEENIKLPANGAEGIFFAIDGKSISLLFLPEKLFDTSCAFFGEQKYIEKQLAWISPFASTFSDAQKFSFAQGVLSYYTLTKKMPFEATSEERLAEDIRDRNFVRIEHNINGIDKNLAYEINSALFRSGNVFSAGTLKILKHELGLTENENEILQPERKHKIPEKEFAEKSHAFYSGRNSIINTKRKIRRNKFFIIAATVAIVAIAAATVTFRSENKKKYTTAGLTSEETAVLYFKSLHTLDSNLLSATSKGKATKAFSSIIASVSVTGKMRAAYGGQYFTAPEERTAGDTPQTEAPVYGIANLTLDGEEVSPIAIEAPTNENHPPAITAEDGIQLSKGTQKKYSAKYSIIILDAAANISENMRHDETVTLTFDGKRWRVTDITEN